MATVFILRVAIAVSPLVVRACSSNGCDASTAAGFIERFWSRLTDANEDPATIGADMSSVAGEAGSFAVTDYAAPFELRKMQVRYSRTPSEGSEDVDVTTHAFLRVVDGTPTDDWTDGTTYAAVESAFDTMFATFKLYWRSFVVVSSYRWHKDGPAWRGDPTPYNPAVRVTTKNIAGTGSSASMLPPQDAMSVTLKTSSRPSWGRFYLPAMLVNCLSVNGRWDDALISGTLQPAIVTCLNACRTAGAIPVVFAPALPQRDKHRRGVVVGQLPARDAIAYGVSGVQVDDIVDVVRRRRYQVPGSRATTSLS